MSSHGFPIWLLSSTMHREFKWTKDSQHDIEKKNGKKYKLLNIKIHFKALVLKTVDFVVRRIHIN
jgi:phosphatidate phosphatase PAH1